MDPKGLGSVKLQMEHKLWGDKPAVKERRRMHDVMDEEGVTQEFAAERFAARRKQKRILEEQAEFYPPIFREKLRDMAFAEHKPLSLRVVVGGNPAAKVSWYRNEIPLERNIRTSTHQSDNGTCTLNIAPAQSGDAGEYKCVARNRLGEVVCRARVPVGSSPDPPSWPIVQGIGSDHALIHWQYPAFDGNSEVLAYKVEYRNRSDNSWMTFSDELIDEKVTVCNLLAGNFYRFRVFARNMFGWSESSYSSEEVRTLHPGDHDLELESTVNAVATYKKTALLRQTSDNVAYGSVAGGRLAERIPGSFEKVSVSLLEADPNDTYDIRKEIYR
jgi:hypothetical protein